MTATLSWMASLGPLTLAVAGVAGSSTPAPVAVRRTLAMATGASVLALAAAVATTILAFGGAIQIDGWAIEGIGFGLYLDRLSTLLLVLVAFVGAVVIRYSRHYLAGDPGQGRFVRRLCLTLAAVLLLIASGNLFQFALAWIATSVGLHGLLVFYPDRPAAVLAARKKFLVSRLGDVCLLAAIVLLYRHFGSLDYRTLLGGADAWRLAGGLPGSLHVAMALLVAAALLKSAQFPAHGWLIEVMETPTPVSALLHAGIINAGGFLVLRFAGLISHSAPALDLLMVAGALTALFGSLVMMTQTSVKVTLAYSTVAQMGFMMLECGLGAWTAALLHLVAHSLYKAHAFLSSGGVADGVGLQRSRSTQALPTPAGLLMVATVIAVVIVLSHAAARWGAQHWLAGSLPDVGLPRGALDGWLMAGIVAAFAALLVLQNLPLRWRAGSAWQALYAHAANGFYVNTLANRWVLRFWPTPHPSFCDHKPGARA